MKKFFVIFVFFVSSCKDPGNAEMKQENDKQKSTMHQDREIALSDTIRIVHPTKNSNVKSPLVVEGEARGYWFFEGSAPVEITDSKENILGRGVIEAEGEWMTEDFVPFSASVNFETTGAVEGFVIFRRSNPSGLQENGSKVKIPVKF